MVMTAKHGRRMTVAYPRQFVYYPKVGSGSAAITASEAEYLAPEG
jgi:hypothetical protein